MRQCSHLRYLCMAFCEVDGGYKAATHKVAPPSVWPADRDTLEIVDISEGDNPNGALLSPSVLIVGDNVKLLTTENEKGLAREEFLKPWKSTSKLCVT